MIEANFDGLVGPTHNYAGLSEGNYASTANALSESRPRMAALQGLAKMQVIASLGGVQGFLPPHERPAMWVLRHAGLTGTDAQILSAAALQQPALLAQAYSASAMWTANAATVAPGADTLDGRTHFVVANLRAMPHRRIEPSQTLRTLRTVFHGRDRFQIDEALPGDGAFGDEGAANHTRLTNASGVSAHLFVYGTSAASGARATRNPARQTLEASRRVAELLQLPADCCVFAQQSPKAIDAGAFHNDVLAVGTGTTLLFHQEAFQDQAGTLASLRKILGNEFSPVMVTTDELSLDEAVSTYLLNSQLLHTSSDNLMLICPNEVREHDRARNVVDRLLVDASQHITSVVYLDVRESMRNGGGPACLRLRVPVADASMTGVHPRFLLTPERALWLQGWIERHYREVLRPDDLADPELLRSVRDALDELTRWLGVTALYPFQGASPP